MASESKGNFITIKPHEKMNDVPIAVFNIVGISEEDTTEYYPIMSNFYDTVVYSGNGTTTLRDIMGNLVPPQALQYNIVNKINYDGTIFWLSTINVDNLIYRSIGSTSYITISTTNDWNTYTVTHTAN